MIVGRYGSFTISREGRPKGKGGKGPGVVWYCTCDKGDLYPVSRCRHIRAFFAHAKRVGEAIQAKPELAELPMSQVWDTAAGKTRVHLDDEGKRAVVRCPCIAVALGRPKRRGAHC
jgi:hypothetical protein